MCFFSQRRRHNLGGNYSVPTDSDKHERIPLVTTAYAGVAALFFGAIATLAIVVATMGPVALFPALAAAIPSWVHTVALVVSVLASLFTATCLFTVFSSLISRCKQNDTVETLSI